MCLGAGSLSLANTLAPYKSPGTARLEKGANAMLNDYQTYFTVLSPEKGNRRVYYNLTVYNKKGADLAKLVVHYDKLTSVKSIKGRVYDLAGKQLAKLKKSDIKDISNYDGFSVFTDNRLKTASFSIHNYPYTVEWEYEVETTNMMFYPVWAPQSDEQLAVKKASLQLRVPEGFALRYIEQQVAPAQISRDGNTEIYNWSVENLKPVNREPYSPGLIEQVPVVYTAPAEFSVEGYAGRMDSWKSYGLWINQLNISQNDLSPAAIAKAQQLTHNLPTDKEKVRAIYDYLQQNTRYVSIQLGIGGWQPFKASFVHEKGYGDCKALSNYTKALLEAVNIPSFYTLIRHGEDRNYLREDFPRSYFNHAILCVPLEQDTVWLECTSQTNPFGFLGSGTHGRKVVLITEDGGQIAQTRYYGAEDNLQLTEAEVHLTEQQAVVNIKRTYTGLQFENGGLSYYLHQDKEEQKKWVYRNLDIPSFNLSDFELSLEKEDVVPEASLKAQLELKSLVTISNKRMFISPNLANRSESAPLKGKERKSAFVLNWAYTDDDMVVYHLPEGYAPEFIPEAANITSKFGHYEAKVDIDGNKLYYSRKLRMQEGRFDAAEYEDYVSFMHDISRADQAKVILVAD